MVLMLARSKAELKSLTSLQGRAMKGCLRSTPVLVAILFALQSTASTAQPAARPGAGAAFTLTIKPKEELEQTKKERKVIGCAVEINVERGEVEWIALDNSRRRFGRGVHCLDEVGMVTGGGGAPPPPPPPPGPPGGQPCIPQDTPTIITCQ